MSNEIKAATISARCVIATIRALGMQAENKQREYLGQSMAYTEDAFVKVIEEEGLHWNAIVTVLHDY